ncbi:ShlB/FhaC/HecB family hemolysin secretion/activation protein [Campylobacter jejuni]|uniref:ShlB/FhaC/HecB family hemolysin secretion/activation protein n=1 Tax=Campylobacter jejuni TaxID=197 RepID=UPI000B4BB080|nr:ShlB/FhaC/HecB family hemolysin secretion/activation protein [Campylobacter jejuni]EAI9165062.1 ShlB/FhaC/HecB family hemolysin secretion/activation protein [Campylobacter jejuni]EAJ0824834.1 ShlB/FhaC/HecB family hemolysin secretion/activation protein [Campylobacter jejuni]EAJ2605946.1 ShlB/FhaC/HecB family hemolysin secretion/activation protein [Campylobacter jejuni]EAJ7086796.1 ShlB/FhaC/HecB family hemolysin secretion/activation protein [Campylobacter jejuni]
MRFVKIVFLLMSHLCLLQADDSTKMFNLLDKRQQQLHIQKEFNELEKKQQKKEDEYSKNEDFESQIYIFKQIRFKKNDKLTMQAESILKRYINKPLRVGDIYNIVKELTNFIISKGYSTSSVTIDEIDWQHDILFLDLEYGFVGEIYLNGDNNTTRLDFGMPLKKGDKFNIYDLDTGIENLNNGARDVKIAVKSNENYGYSDIFVNLEPKLPDLILDFDNSGSKAKGEYKASTYLSLSNVFNLNDSIRFGFIKGLLKNMSQNRENVYILSYNLPIQSYQLSYSLQYSDNRNLIAGYDDSFINNKDTSLRHKIMLKKILHRTNKDKFSIYVNVNIKDDINEINNFRLESSSGRYSNIVSGVEYSTVAFSGFLFVNLEYEKGIPFLGSKRDSRDSLYKIEFNKVNFNLSYQKNFYINDDIAFLYQNSFGASYSNEPLLYSNKFLIGDEYTVRGFKESSAALDYGMYSNNTVYLQFLNASKYLRKLEPFIGIDMGYGRDYLLPNKDFLAGVAFGFRYNLNHFSLNLTASKAIHKSSNMPSETIPIYLRASVSF